MHAGQGSRGPTAGDDPNGTQTVHLPLGFFRPQFLLQINLTSFLQAWLEPSVSSRNSHTYTRSAQGTLAWVRHRPRAVPLSSHLGGIQP